MKVLILTIGSHGDVHPFLGIAAALRRRGHDVTMVASPYFDSLICAMGLNYVPLGKAEEFESMARDPQIWHPLHGPIKIANSIEHSLPQSYQAILDHAEPGKTVLVYSSLSFAARIAQETLHLPGVTVHLSPILFRSVYDPPKFAGMHMPDWMPHWMKRGIYKLTDVLVTDRYFAPPINRFRKRLGLPPVKGIFRDYCHSPRRVIGLFPDWYAPPQPDWPAQARLTGFPLFDETEVTPLPPDVERFLNSGSQPIAFTPGSANFFAQNFFAAAADACRLMGRRGILLTRHADQVPAQLPEGVIHAAYAPFSRLLPRCAATVHHGGIGSTAQGLAAGVPQLLMPMAYDQIDNAARIKKLGVGDELIPRDFTAPNVATKLGRLVSSTATAEACKQIAAKFVGFDALAMTVELIEALK